MSIVMRRVRDRNLAEPFRRWIDRAVPLPPGVTVLARTIEVGAEVLGLLAVGFVCAVMTWVFIGGVTGWLRHLPNAGGAAFLLVSLAVVVVVPIWMGLGLWRTIEARRDAKAGRLRQGVLVGPEGVLVRRP